MGESGLALQLPNAQGPGVRRVNATFQPAAWREKGRGEVWPAGGAVTKSEWHRLGAKSCLGSSGSWWARS